MLSANGTPAAGAAPPEFFSGDVARMAKVSLRQLQWLDERHLVSPDRNKRRRCYSLAQVLEILAIADLRRKGLSLQRIGKVVRLLRRELDAHLPALTAPSTRLYLLTDGKSVHLAEDPEQILGRLAGAAAAMYVACLSDLFRTIAPEDRPRRRRSRQLDLF